MEYSALDVARYVINYSNEKSYGISNLKLQKLLYFIQAEFLVFTDKKEPCFQEEIEAWGFGPVVPCVYREFKQFGSCNIPTVDTYYEISDTWDIVKKTYNKNILKAEDREIINEIVDGLSEYSAADLVRITHNQLPWQKVYVQGMNNTITKKSIREYFEKDAD